MTRHLYSISYFCFFFFFFFQAEDGIRDVAVTGVQTCALPIFREIGPTPLLPGRDDGEIEFQFPRHSRSEERRVGKGVDLGGRRIIKKKKKIYKKVEEYERWNLSVVSLIIVRSRNVSGVLHCWL